MYVYILSLACLNITLCQLPLASELHPLQQSFRNTKQQDLYYSCIVNHICFIPPRAAGHLVSYSNLE